MDENIEYYKDYCRLCTTRGQHTSVLQNKNGTNFQELISKHLNITILETDLLPKMICGDCEEKLVTFHEYFESCNKLQDLFTKWSLNNENNMDVKNEEQTNIETFTIILSADAISTDYKNTLKTEVKVETSHSRSPSPNYSADSCPDSEHSTVPLSMLSNLKKKKVKRKHKIKTKKEIKVKSEKPYFNSTKSDINIRDYINFSCSVCKKKCYSWYDLRTHTMRVHNTKPFVKCVQCNVIIKSKTVMYKHFADHKKPSIFTCDICPKITKSATAMEIHKMRHIPKAEKVFKCNLCSKSLKSKESLKYHRLCHLPIEQRKQIPCTMCDMKFTTKSAAIGHKRVVHDKIKRFVCDLCGYACATAHELRQHRAIHSEDKLFVCNICSKPFKTDSNLRTHIDTHSSTSYQCSICNKVLNTRRTFRKHLLVHETQRKHVCSFCKVAFKRRQTLKVHLNSHTGDKPIACQWCGDRFMYAASYRTHKQRRHPEKLMQMQDHLNKEIDHQANETSHVAPLVFS